MDSRDSILYRDGDKTGVSGTGIAAHGRRNGDGLGQGSTEVLDNLGIMLKAEEAYKSYAEQIGKTSKELTDVEKRQAVVTVLAAFPEDLDRR